jgi:hypothetical protein
VTLAYPGDRFGTLEVWPRAEAVVTVEDREGRVGSFTFRPAGGSVSEVLVTLERDDEGSARPAGDPRDLDGEEGDAEP